jgi:hypothetical protein
MYIMIMEHKLSGGSRNIKMGGAVDSRLWRRCQDSSWRNGAQGQRRIKVRVNAMEDLHVPVSGLWRIYKSVNVCGGSISLLMAEEDLEVY